MATDTSDQTFALAEYREAANAYFKGVDIGYTTLKGFIGLNGLFAAVLGALADKAPSLDGAAEMIKLIPGFALACTFALIVCLPHYFRHLENCRLRCQEIEKAHGGALFTRLGHIAKGTNKVNALVGLVGVVLMISAFWVYFVIKMQYPDFKISGIIKGLF